MLSKKTLILKIGGSVLTKKALATPEGEWKRLRAIAQALEQSFDPEKFQLILIHGAGSFGHVPAKKYGLEQGTKDHPEKEPLALEVQASVKKLHEECLSILRSAGLPVQSVPTHTITTNNEGVLFHVETNSLQAALAKNQIPVVYGDMVPDNTWGYSICSGDVLAAKLAQDFKAQSVFFASDVAGIYTEDPHLFSDAKLIPETSLTQILSGHIRLDASHNVDVTGGLASKFLLFNDCPALQHIYLFNGQEPKNFSLIFKENPNFGTHITV